MLSDQNQFISYLQPALSNSSYELENTHAESDTLPLGGGGGSKILQSVMTPVPFIFLKNFGLL